MYNDSIIVLESYILKYKFLPNKILYFNAIDNCKLICSDCKNKAFSCLTRVIAEHYQDEIFRLFGFKFQIEKEV